MELILGEVQTNSRGGKFLPLKGNPMWRSTEPAAVMWEPSAYKDAAGDRVNVCLEATEEALAAVGSWEAAAAKMAAKQAPAMFGKPLTEAQLQERFQSCLKTSAQGCQVRKAQGHAAQRAVLGQRGQAHRGARLSQGKANPGCGAAPPAVGDESAVWVAPGAAGRQAGRGRGRVPAIGKGSRCGLRARPEAQQGPAGQPH